MDKTMQRPIFHSELPSSRRSSDAANIAYLKNELSRLVPVTRFSLNNQPLDIMIRGLTSSRSPSDCHQQRIQYREDDEQDTDCDLNQMDAFSLAVAKRSKTNSERGRAFRARRKKYEDDLETIVNSLRQEVADLDFLLSVRADKVLRSRNSTGGSLVRLVREYFVLFERGIPSLRSVGQKRPALLTDGSGINSTGDLLAAKQEAFLKSLMDSEMQFGGVRGPEYLLDQWKRYTSYHSSFHVEVLSIEVSGEENDPIVTGRLYLRVVFSRATFEYVFPHVADNEELMNKFIGREVIYHSTNHFHFSPKGQILIYETNVGFVDALVQAGANVSEIALLMQQARIADECRLGDNNHRAQELEQDNLDEITSPDGNNSHGTSDKATGVNSSKDRIESSGSDAEEVSPQEISSRLAIDFLLS
ncbi:unnamed protein product [Peronospora destructor]|uniref:BZIP domain-containing protein n=1 Tax=Peronospora destructor TaxID=86335 RepID=A0AAV0TI43_9STRA|nr:unnamed protein product [Peronospora destructor]